MLLGGDMWMGYWGKHMKAESFRMIKEYQRVSTVVLCTMTEIKLMIFIGKGNISSCYGFNCLWMYINITFFVISHDCLGVLIRSIIFLEPFKLAVRTDFGETSIGCKLV